MMLFITFNQKWQEHYENYSDKTATVTAPAAVIFGLVQKHMLIVPFDLCYLKWAIRYTVFFGNNRDLLDNTIIKKKTNV